MMELVNQHRKENSLKMPSYRAAIELLDVADRMRQKENIVVHGGALLCYDNILTRNWLRNVC